MLQVKSGYNHGSPTAAARQVSRPWKGTANYNNTFAHSPSPQNTTITKVSFMMKLKFPEARCYSKSLRTAALLAIIGSLVYPLLGLTQFDPRKLFTLTLLAGALLGGILSAITLVRGAASSTTTGEGARKTIFVGNLAFKANRDELRALFEQYGAVYSVRIMTDRVTRRPRGFAFVEMDEGNVAAAIKGLNGKELYGRNLRVNEGNDQRQQRDNI